jgi:prepilin-type N-terminal cleavage/methylation domain-containing protein
MRPAASRPKCRTVVLCDISQFAVRSRAVGLCSSFPSCNRAAHTFRTVPYTCPETLLGVAGITAYALEMHGHPPTRQRRAFSLVEVMVVVAIAGILAAMSVATLRAVAMASREIGAARGVGALIKRGRALAIQDHRLVRINTTEPDRVFLESCPSQYGIALCAIGYTLQPVLRAEVVTRQGQGDAAGVVVTTTGPGELIFSATGLPTVTAGPWQLTFDHPETPGSRAVFVTAVGEVRVE